MRPLTPALAGAVVVLALEVRQLRRRLAGLEAAHVEHSSRPGPHRLFTDQPLRVMRSR